MTNKVMIVGVLEDLEKERLFGKKSITLKIATHNNKKDKIILVEANVISKKTIIDILEKLERMKNNFYCYNGYLSVGKDKLYFICTSVSFVSEGKELL